MQKNCKCAEGKDPSVVSLPQDDTEGLRENNKSRSPALRVSYEDCHSERSEESKTRIDCRKDPSVVSLPQDDMGNTL